MLWCSWSNVALPKSIRRISESFTTRRSRFCGQGQGKQTVSTARDVTRGHIQWTGAVNIVTVHTAPGVEGGGADQRGHDAAATAPCLTAAPGWVQCWSLQGKLLTDRAVMSDHGTG